jgi:SAM-dependent methyltransferase
LKELLNKEKLLASGVVANNRMNRERGCQGKNSYQKDLFFNPLEFPKERIKNGKPVSWLDIGCGEGCALIEAAKILADLEGIETRNLQIIGIDLAGMFQEFSSELKYLSLLETAVEDFEPSQKFDLITCVHSLHYIGDKLSVIRKAACWLKDDGIFLANLELKNLKLLGEENSRKIFSDFLNKQGFTIDGRRHLLMLEGYKIFELPFEYVGADDQAGPNYTGQPAVNSYYKF